MNVTEKVKNAMTALNKKPAAVAREADIDVSDFYKFLSGKKDMNGKTLERVFIVLNLDLVIAV